MVKTLGYMVTWTTYGTWLQGDERGYVKDGSVLKKNRKLRDLNKLMLRREAVKLTKREREVVRDAIIQAAVRWEQRVYAIAVCSNHVHVVVSYNGKDIGRCVRNYKNASFFALRRDGFTGRVWTRGYDKRYCFYEESLRARVDYVKRHK